MDISPPESSTPTRPPPKSPSASSASSSDFEFTVSLSPTSRKPSHLFCPADELFYKGQLLPLHLSPRLSMVRTLLLASSRSSSSSDATTAVSRDSTGSSADSTASFSSSSDLLLFPDCDSARPSSAAEDLFPFDDDFKKPKKFKYLPSLPKLSSVFTRRESKSAAAAAAAAAAAPTKRITATAKEVIRKYVKKVKPLYERLASKQNNPHSAKTNASVFSMMQSTATSAAAAKPAVGFAMRKRDAMGGVDGFGCGVGSYSHSFSGNLRYPRRRSCVSSCPSSMRSSPSHSGVLRSSIRVGGMYLDSSSMEELQNAIQGAIAHCKKSMREGDEQQQVANDENR